MKLIVPRDVTDAILASSSIAENDYPAWASVTTYARGDFVISPSTHTVYRSLTDGNLGNDPNIEMAALADPLIDDPSPVNWQLIGATNRWRMFDKKPSVQATATGSISVDLTPGQIVGGLACFNVTAAQVTIEGASVVGGGAVYSRTVAMQDNTVVVDWYSYYFTPITPLEEFAVTDIPPYGDITLTATFTGSGTVGCGQLVIGDVRTLGETTVDGSGFTGFDFSLVQQDEFGNLTTVQRAATRVSEFDVFVSNQTLLGFDNLMRSLRGGVAAVWIGDDDQRKAALNYGFYRDYRTVYKTSDYAVVSLQIQGIV